MNDIHTGFAKQGLIRPRQGRILGGVCAGLAQRFGLDPTLTRLLFVVAMVVIPGSQILVYPLLWALMPSQEATDVSGWHRAGTDVGWPPQDRNPG